MLGLGSSSRSGNRNSVSGPSSSSARSNWRSSAVPQVEQVGCVGSSCLPGFRGALEGLRNRVERFRGRSNRVVPLQAASSSSVDDSSGGILGKVRERLKAIRTRRDNRVRPLPSDSVARRAVSPSLDDDAPSGFSGRVRGISRVGPSVVEEPRSVSPVGSGRVRRVNVVRPLPSDSGTRRAVSPSLGDDAPSGFSGRVRGISRVGPSVVEEPRSVSPVGSERVRRVTARSNSSSSGLSGMLGGSTRRNRRRGYGYFTINGSNSPVDY